MSSAERGMKNPVPFFLFSSLHHLVATAVLYAMEPARHCYRELYFENTGKKKGRRGLNLEDYSAVSPSAKDMDAVLHQKLCRTSRSVVGKSGFRMCGRGASFRRYDRFGATLRPRTLDKRSQIW